MTRPSASVVTTTSPMLVSVAWRRGFPPRPTVAGRGRAVPLKRRRKVRDEVLGRDGAPSQSSSRKGRRQTLNTCLVQPVRGCLVSPAGRVDARFLNESLAPVPVRFDGITEDGPAPALHQPHWCYAELRLGRQLFPGSTGESIREAVFAGPPNLAPLHEAEQAVLRRALSSDRPKSLTPMWPSLSVLCPKPAVQTRPTQRHRGLPWIFLRVVDTS